MTTVAFVDEVWKVWSYYVFEAAQSGVENTISLPSLRIIGVTQPLFMRLTHSSIGTSQFK